jgi:ceramide glucosyltransferase
VNPNQAAGLSLVALSSAAYLVMLGAFFRARGRAKEPPAPWSRAPRVSVLKPLAGIDDELDANLESFARIDYPAFEILLGVASADDPAYAVAANFVARHPKLDARVVITSAAAAPNPKVAQLVALQRLATGAVLVISDSNVRVGRRYLESLVRELDDHNVGLVTSLFVGTGERSLGAALENLQVGVYVAPSIAASAVLAPRPFTVGKSMAMWRRDVALMGGFRAVGDVLAEDHLLGRKVDEQNKEIRLSMDAVENRNVACSLRRTIERHTRWAKLRRTISPGCFALEPMGSPLTVATLFAVLAPGSIAWALMAWGLALQLAGAMLAMRALRGQVPWRLAALEPLRSYVTFACWLRACASKKVMWRGNPIRLGKDSRIHA